MDLNLPSTFAAEKGQPNLSCSVHGGHDGAYKTLSGSADATVATDVFEHAHGAAEISADNGISAISDAGAAPSRVCRNSGQNRSTASTIGKSESIYDVGDDEGLGGGQDNGVATSPLQPAMETMVIASPRAQASVPRSTVEVVVPPLQPEATPTPKRAVETLTQSEVVASPRSCQRRKLRQIVATNNEENPSSTASSTSGFDTGDEGKESSSDQPNVDGKDNHPGGAVASRTRLRTGIALPPPTYHYSDIMWDSKKSSERSKKQGNKRQYKKGTCSMAAT